MNNTIKTLEDVIAWQEARSLMRLTYSALVNYPKKEDYNICKHMKECSRNIPANIAEGFGRYNYQECMQFYRIARGSLNELKSDLYCSLDLKYLDQNAFNELINKVEKVSQLLNGLIASSYKAKVNFKNTHNV